MGEPVDALARLPDVCGSVGGFVASAAGHHTPPGIGSVQGRAQLLGGEFEIHSEPGKGARIEVWVPLLSNADQVKS
jgi:signal transduction histidine kinase